MLPSASMSSIDELFRRAAAQPSYRLTVDLESRVITDDAGLPMEFEVDDFRRHCLLHGLDDVALTLEQENKITAYETARGIA